MDKITNSTLFKRSPELVFTDLDGETIMMSLENNSYYGLNPVATRIWELLSEPKSLENIVDELTSEYDITPEQCKNEVIVFLEEMINKKTINIA
jgi:hypothetical protein